MSESFDMRKWWYLSSITAIESKNQVVILGRRSESRPWSLYMFQNNINGELVETRMDYHCQHFASFPLITVVQNGKELIAVLCNLCKDIKLVDTETKQITPVFKFHTDSPYHMFSGPDGGFSVALSRGNIQQLDSSFSVINTFDLSSFFSDDHYLYYTAIPMCYLPVPRNTLFVSNVTELTAMSLDRHQV